MKYLALLPYTNTVKRGTYHLARPDGKASYCGSVWAGHQRTSGHTWTVIDERPEGYECSNCPGAKAKQEHQPEPPKKPPAIIRLLLSRFGDGKIHWAKGKLAGCNPGAMWSSRWIFTKGEAESVTCKRCRGLLGLAALEVETGVEAGSVNLAFLDPPYYKVKNLDWDHQWSTPADFLAWMGQVCQGVKRALAPNGSLYLCASPQMAWGVEGVVREWFNVLNVIRWQKADGTFSRADVTGYRTWLAAWEAVIFAEQYGADGMALGESGYNQKCDELRGFVFEPLRAYLDGERKRAALTRSQVGAMIAPPPHGEALTNHFFRSGQWMLPTAENYTKLQAGFNNGNPGEYLRRDYDKLKADYDKLKADYESLRRPFHPTRELYRDDWHYAQVEANDEKHPTAKPLPMLLDIIRTSSRPGDLVLDCFLGGGTTLAAAAILGRRFVGGDIQAHWVKASLARLKEARGEWGLKVKREMTAPTPQANDRGEVQMSMFKDIEETAKCK